MAFDGLLPTLLVLLSEAVTLHPVRSITLHHSTFEAHSNSTLGYNRLRPCLPIEYKDGGLIIASFSSLLPAPIQTRDIDRQP